jgi:hypothetical protein
LHEDFKNVPAKHQCGGLHNLSLKHAAWQTPNLSFS